MRCYGIKLRSVPKIRYVGLTTRSLELRLKEHKLSAAGPKKKTRLYRWLVKHADDDIEIVELGTAATRRELGELEISLISKYREIGEADLNMADGGIGGVSDETIAKIKQTFANPAHIKMRSEITRKLWTHSDVRAKAKASRIKADQRPETKVNRPLAATKWQNDPVVGKSLSERSRKAAQTEGPAARGVRSKKIQARPEVKAAKSAKMTAFWVEWRLKNPNGRREKK